MTDEAIATADPYERSPRSERIARRDFAFVHINKCGGRSVEHALGLPKFHGDAKRLRKLHGREKWADIYSFSVVRNPYARIASLYRYRLSKERLGEPPVGFAEWVVRVFRDRDPALRDGEAMFRPAFDWLHDRKGRLMVRETFRLEELAQHWDHILEQVGRGEPLPHRNANPSSTPLSEAYDDTARAVVTEVFAADLDTWQYSFPE
ncbi:sulfotransferase family 2 domain-containing protein [Halovulum sp. GXIMD14794]